MVAGVAVGSAREWSRLAMARKFVLAAFWPAGITQLRPIWAVDRTPQLTLPVDSAIGVNLPVGRQFNPATAEV